jgi:DNA-3-methyladenine glycosylase I
MRAIDMTETRCAWANLANPLYLHYHDHEWGVPCHDELQLFEMLNLEGAQAGLSWETVLNKRENYRLAFDHWNAEKIAAYGDEKVAALMQDGGIIRNQLKIRSTITNAKAYLLLCQEFGGLDTYLWAHVNGKPIVNSGERIITTPLSDQISKDLKKRGFKFVGSTIIYAYLQGIGVVNDHAADCAWRKHGSNG